MADNTAIHLLGPGTLTLDGTDVGYVSEASLALTFTEVEALVAAYGDTPVDTFRIAEKAQFKVIFNEIGFQNYQKAIQGATRNTSGSNEDISLGAYAGVRQTSMELVWTPIASEISTTHALKIWRVVPTGDRTIDFGIESPQGLEATFKAQIDASKTDGEKLLRFGNVSVSADTSAPTISSVNLDTGVATAKTVTFNEALNPSTVNSNTVVVMLATDSGTQTPVAGTVSLNAAGTVVTYTPSSSLSSATAYNIILTPGIKNASNIAFGGEKRSFTTA